MCDNQGEWFFCTSVLAYSASIASLQNTKSLSMLSQRRTLTIGFPLHAAERSESFLDGKVLQRVYALLTLWICTFNFGQGTLYNYRSFSLSDISQTFPYHALRKQLTPGTVRVEMDVQGRGSWLLREPKG